MAPAATINRRGMNPLEDLSLIRNYKRLIEELKPDLILTYTIKPNIYGNYVANKLKIPVIMNITGMGSSLITGRLKEVIKKMYRYACHKAEIVFFQNKGNYQFFISNNLVKKDKTKIIPGSGVNLENFKPLKKLKTDGVIRFLYIGRLMKDKGIEEYLEVAKRISDQYKNSEFQILGLFEEEKYRSLIENNKNHQIKYLGISYDVRNEIREVDCVVNPSYHEGMSNVLLEAAAMAKPLIASNIDGCKEIIDAGINGFLVDVGSVSDLEAKIIQFIELKDDQKMMMGQHSRKKVASEFDRDVVIKEYLNVINKILEMR